MNFEHEAEKIRKGCEAEFPVSIYGLKIMNCGTFFEKKQYCPRCQGQINQMFKDYTEFLELLLSFFPLFLEDAADKNCLAKIEDLRSALAILKPHVDQ